MGRKVKTYKAWLSFRGNFLHVDIFYKELKYQSIKTNEAFSLGSMFGEIGGFLGLLLGASVLTVCEIFDHVILSIITTWNNRKKKPRKFKMNDVKIKF